MANKRIDAVDGLRGVSVVMVIISHHLGETSIPGVAFHLIKTNIHGGLGVLFFFVISGFVISQLLLTELNKTKTIDLLQFYKRRFVRLAPALFLFLAISYLVSYALGFAPTTACMVAGATFSEGFFHSCGGQYGHLWSLTAEEIFYLLFPFSLLLTRKEHLFKLFMVLILACSGIRVLQHLSTTGLVKFWPTQINLSIFGYLDQMATGVFLAVLLRMHPEKARSFFQWHPMVTRVVAALGIIAIQELRYFGKMGFVLLPFGVLLQALFFALILGSVVQAPKGILFRFLTKPYLVWLGLCSYSLYLWQEVLIAGGATQAVWLAFIKQFPVNLVAMVGLAYLSYRFVEKPVRRYAERRGFICPGQPMTSSFDSSLVPQSGLAQRGLP